jgi:hypothetical protein
MPTNKNLQWKREYDRKRYREKRDAIIARLGGKCVRCGSITSLQLDHVDPALKSFDISTKADHVDAKELDREINKCQLLCKGCHLDKSIREKGHVPLSERGHGHISMYRNGGCRCDLCKSAINKAHIQYKLRTGRIKRARTALVHGTANAYGYHKCRCDACKEGQRVRAKEWYNKVKSSRISPHFPKVSKE